MIAEFLATLKAIQAIAGLLKEANDLRKQEMEAYEQRQIEEFKKQVNIQLEQIKVATTDADRKRLIIELSKQLQR